MTACIADAVKAYFTEGSLPPDEHECPAEGGIFWPPKYPEVGQVVMSLEDRIRMGQSLFGLRGFEWEETAATV